MSFQCIFVGFLMFPSRQAVAKSISIHLLSASYLKSPINDLYVLPSHWYSGGSLAS